MKPEASPVNLRIADPVKMVEALHYLLLTHGVLRLTAGPWVVTEVRGRLFYCSTERVEVGGPYETLGALLRDAGRRRDAWFAKPEDPEPVWEVIEWGGAFFRVESADLAAPGRYETLEAARP